ncbi:MAG TPA: site-2 protease family protein [Candidatus Limnocylindrales bacterium]|jgi:Zn-dependent protease
MNGIPVARILGFEIRVHPSWIFILAILSVLVVGRLEVDAPAIPIAVRWLIGAVIALAFLASVLLHELGHATVARRRGLRTAPITLYFFGGSASYDIEPEHPRDEAAVALAGPAVSLAVATVLGAAGIGLQFLDEPAALAAGIVLILLALLNLVLGAVNLIPAFPLDGGRLVHAAVWGRTGDERRGAHATATAGRVVGWGLVAVGLLVVLDNDPFNGVMLGLAGWMLSTTARGIDRRITVENLLRGVRVDEVMERDVPSVPSQLTVDTFAEQLFTGESGTAYPVVRGDQVVGVLGASQLRRVSRGKWASMRAEEAMTALSGMGALAPDEGLWQALQRMRRAGVDGLPVLDGTVLAGVLTLRSVAAAVQARAKVAGVSLR